MEDVDLDRSSSRDTAAQPTSGPPPLGGDEETPSFLGQDEIMLRELSAQRLVATRCT